MTMEWFSVTLRCYHPDWDPNDISSQLGMMPSISWKVGDRCCTPNGDLLKGERSSSYWCSQKLSGDWGNPSQTLLQHVATLESKRAFLEKVLATGGRIEFFLGWGLPGPTGGQFLDANLLSRLGELGIDLSIDVYAQELTE
jgi:hypothetical protein